jgi:signal peptidase II
MKSKKWLSIALIILTIALNIGCDQGTKDFARKHFRDRGEIQVIGNFFIIKYTENIGAFLSLGSTLPQSVRFIFLSVIPAIVLAGLTIFILFDKNLSRMRLFSLSCIIGGGISNIFDRFVYNGRVSDFLNFGIDRFRTGILNFSDLSITIGAVILILTYFNVQKTNKEQSLS